MVVPPHGQAEVLKVLHEGHPRDGPHKALTRSYVWWPGIDNDITEKVKE